MWQNSTQLKLWENLKTQNLTQLNNSHCDKKYNCDKTKKKTETMTRLKKKNQIVTRPKYAIVAKLNQIIKKKWGKKNKNCGGERI